MPILLIILATVLALAWRARVVQRCFNPVDAEMRELRCSCSCRWSAFWCSA